MAAPKKKLSRVRTKRRHAAYRSRLRTIISNKSATVACSHCGGAKIPHTVCAACGYYRGKEVIHVHGDHEHVTKVTA